MIQYSVRVFQYMYVYDAYVCAQHVMASARPVCPVCSQRLDDLIRVYNVECVELYESELACYGSLARNVLGVVIGVVCIGVGIFALRRACCAPPSVGAHLWGQP